MSRKRRNSDGSRLFDLGDCAFCGRTCDDELLYGKLIKSDFLTAHSNCLFLSSGLYQEGNEDTDEYYGFLRKDIEAELHRGKKLFCCYCRKRGATVGCCEIKCKRSFHLPCGIEHGALNQFFDSFSSFCKDHAPKQNMKAIPEGFICHICCEDMYKDTRNHVLYSPCCKNSWFHKLCLQKYALSAGLYFFKCPLCNNSKDFIREMEFLGIRIPEKDASWELEENAYQDLLIKPECDAVPCLCPRGRSYSPTKKSGWSLLPCKYCGYHARHKNCENIKPSQNSWICSECREMEMPKKKVTSQEDAESVKPTIEYSLVKDTEKFLSVPSTSQDSNILSQIEDNTKLSEFDPLQTVNINSTELSVNINHKFELIDRKSVTTKKRVLPCHITESKVIKSDKNVTEKQILNLKEITIPLKATCIVSLNRIVPHNSHAVKRSGKKQKFGAPCNSPVCIRKYFGQECCKFRI